MTDLRHTMRAWLLESSHDLARQGILFDIHSNDGGDKPAARLDLHGIRAQIQIIVWASGEMEIHANVDGTESTRCEETIDGAMLRMALDGVVSVLCMEKAMVKAMASGPPRVRRMGDPRTDVSSAWTLMPPGEGNCSQCDYDHEPHEPHNQRSIYYQYAFHAEHSRFPTWEDAMAHCDDKVYETWRVSLGARGIEVAPRCSPGE